MGLAMAGMTCAGPVEIDEYCNRVLEKHWPAVPRWRDVKEINPADLPAVELICGGYPCQPFSLSGERRGQEDDRHLWPFIFSIIAQKKPAWCLFENVVGHVTLGLDQVLSDLESLGYATWPLIIPACAVGALHQRDRIWIMANAPGFRFICDNSKIKAGVDYQNSERRSPKEADLFFDFRGGGNVSDSFDVRTFYEFPYGMDRVKSCGNAIVWKIPYELGRAILLAHGREEK